MPKTVVIVGTSRGIGKSLADWFNDQIDVHVHCLSRKQGELKPSEKLFFHPFDLAKDVRKQADEIFKSIGQVDILINNAGFLVSKPFPEITEFDLEQSYQVNVLGVMQTVQAVLPYLTIAGAHIVNISSMGGYQGSVKFAGLSAYSTSKAALCSFTELFSEEYKESTVAMNCLCLGAVQTEMLSEAFPGYEAPLSSNEMAEFIADFALNGHRFLKGKILPISLSTP